MFESITQLLSTDNSEQNTILVLLFISFLIGMFLWALLAHLPMQRSLKKKFKSVAEEKDKLQKENKKLSERYTIVNAKYERSCNDLQNTEATLSAKIQSNEEQKENIKMITGQLELYKDHARNFKESKEKLSEEFQRIVAENKKNILKTENLKNIVEEIELEKNNLLNKNSAQQQQLVTAQENNNALKKTLTERDKNLELIKQDLEQTQHQKSKFKKMIYELEAAQPLNKALEEDLRKQILDLQTHIHDLEMESADLMKRLAPFREQEEAIEQSKVLSNDYMETLLSEASEALTKEGLYQVIDETKLIEDTQYLNRALAEIKPVLVNKLMTKTKLTQKEENEFAAALEEASVAMAKDGFYEVSEDAASPDNNSISNETINTKQTASKAVEQSKKKVDVEQLVHAIKLEVKNNIPSAQIDQKDDLQRIDGIGSFVEQQLNQYGIYTFEQISKFSPAFIDMLGTALGFSGATILRDKWVEQAGILSN